MGQETIVRSPQRNIYRELASMPVVLESEHEF